MEVPLSQDHRPEHFNLTLFVSVIKSRLPGNNTWLGSLSTYREEWRGTIKMTGSHECSVITHQYNYNSSGQTPGTSLLTRLKGWDTNVDGFWLLIRPWKYSIWLINSFRGDSAGLSQSHFSAISSFALHH